MELTPAQLATVAADILAKPDLNSQPLNRDGSYQIYLLYNAVSATDVWRTDAPVQDIYDAIDWSKYTPTDAPDGTAIFTNRLLAIQTKQMNLQNMLQGRSTVDASKANLRAGLRDAVIGLPAGANGALITAGGASGATVLAALTRKALRIEALFAALPATTGNTTAQLLVWQGQIDLNSILQARGL